MICKDTYKTILQAEEIRYRYPQNGHGLDATTFQAQPGEFILITGPSGCGKSTLARCLTGLIPHLYRGHLEGEVWLQGLLTAETPLWQLAAHAGLVFQNPAAQMLGTSVEEEIIFGLENLGLPRREIKKRLDATLKRFGLEGMRQRAPQRLSGGEQQKLALAAMIARQPEVLILDEPLSMLDSTAAHDLVSHLTHLAQKGTTVVICEHRAAYLEQTPNLRTIQMPTPIVHPHAASQESPAIPRLSLETPPFELAVEGLSVQLGQRPVLHNLNVTLSGGEIVAVVGRNGIGKTTLLRALAGLQKHTGRVHIQDEQPALGMVFQNADLQLFNPTVRDEILYRCDAPDMTLYRHLLEILGLVHYERIPPLLLSEGEKKRVALATILMRHPRHGVLLDEPSLGQDGAHKTHLCQMMRALANSGQAVILTTHDLDLASQADRMLLLGKDGWAADGPPAEVLRDKTAWDKIGLSVPDWLPDDAAKRQEGAR